MGTHDYFTILFSLFAALFSYYSFRKSREFGMYQDLDRLYLEMLKIAIQYPNFVKPHLTGDYERQFKDDDLVRYELYAFSIWNICETIYDRKSNDEFFKTWKCVMDVENELHRNWFDNEINHRRFKEGFRQYIKDTFPLKNVSSNIK